MSRCGPIGQYNTRQVLCNDSRPCFANINGRCVILSESYEVDGACPFCKARYTDKAVRKKNVEAQSAQ